MSAPDGSTLRVALGEYDIGWEDPSTALERAGALVRQAADAGARLVVFPEMFATGFTMDAAKWAEPLDGEISLATAELAARHGVWIIAGIAARDRDGRAVNAAAVFDASGDLVAGYRKQRLFAFSGEHQSYAAGTEPVIVDVEGVRISPFVCYDLRFPELFGAVARDVDAIVVIANWPAARRMHWDVLVRARAIENQCYMVAVNRIGTGGTLEYDGGSVVYDPWGHRVSDAGSPTAPACADLDPSRVRDVRTRYPFLADRVTR